MLKMATNVLGPASEEVQLLSNPTPFLQSTLLSPICRLPDEILANIFLHVVQYWYKLCRCSPHLTRPPDWVEVLCSVCRRWNYVILNWPPLWCYIVTASHHFVEVLLFRSRQLPLKICIPGQWGLYSIHAEGRRWLSTLLETLEDHVERIQELNLDCEVLLQLFTKPSLRASRLRSLRIYTGPCGQSCLESFNLDTPVLRTLHLDYCPMLWGSLALDGLTSLSLSYVPSNCKQGVAEFLADLSRMQNLRYLSLNDALPSARDFISSPAFNVPLNVTLPHLSRLLITAQSSTIFALLSHIDIPMKAELRIDVTCEFDDARDHTLITSLVNGLAQRIDSDMAQDHKQSNLAIRTLAIDAGYRLCLALTFAGSGSSGCMVSNYHSLRWDADLEWGCDIPLKIVIQLSSIIEKRGFRVLSDFCLALPLSTFQRVDVKKPPLSSHFWKNLLGRLSDVRYLTLRDGCMPDLAGVLSLSGNGEIDPGKKKGDGHCPMAHLAGNSTSIQIIAPALKEVELVDIDFLGDSYQGMETVADGRPGVNVQSLLDALASRKLRLPPGLDHPESLMKNRVSTCFKVSLPSINDRVEEVI